MNCLLIKKSPVTSLSEYPLNQTETVESSTVFAALQGATWGGVGTPIYFIDRVTCQEF